MKAAGLTLIFICCLLGGAWIDQDQRKRIKELAEITYLFELLKAEINYQLTPLGEACNRVGEHGKQSVGKIFIEFANALLAKESTDIQGMWQSALNKHKHTCHLLEEDYDLLKDFGGACGYLDKQMQERNLEMMIEKIEHERKLLEEKYERCSKLNRSLGLLVGATLVIFLI